MRKKTESAIEDFVDGFFARLLVGNDKANFIENLSMLISSGAGVKEILDSLEEEARSGAMKKIIQTMRGDIESGFPLWNVLERSHLFPAHAISLIRLGEESGNLDENLQIVSEQIAKDKEFRSKLRSAMMYPVFVLGLTGFVGVGIAWFILPKLSAVFGQMDIELPKITSMLIGAGAFLEDYGNIAVPSFVAIFIILFFITIYIPVIRNGVRSFFFVLPGIGSFLQQVEVARFTYLLGILLKAGMPVVEAISSVEQATQFSKYKKFIHHISTNIEDGKSFRECFTSYKGAKKLIPTPVQQYIVAGERSGNLSQSLLRVSERYEVKVDTGAKNLATMLEPILLVIVWLGVVAVALAVILPIYSLVGQFNANG